MTKNSLTSMGMLMRTGIESDYGFVHDSMINSLHGGNPVYKSVRMRTFKKAIKKQLASSLNTPLRLNVVCDANFPDTIYGWVLHDFRGKVIYLYVQQLWRSKGIGTALLDSVPNCATHAHWTFAARDWARRRGLEFVPVEFE